MENRIEIRSEHGNATLRPQRIEAGEDGGFKAISVDLSLEDLRLLRKLAGSRAAFGTGGRGTWVMTSLDLRDGYGPRGWQADVGLKAVAPRESSGIITAEPHFDHVHLSGPHGEIDVYYPPGLVAEADGDRDLAYRLLMRTAHANPDGSDPVANGSDHIDAAIRLRQAERYVRGDAKPRALPPPPVDKEERAYFDRQLDDLMLPSPPGLESPDPEVRAAEAKLPPFARIFRQNLRSRGMSVSERCKHCQVLIVGCEQATEWSSRRGSFWTCRAAGCYDKAEAFIEAALTWETQALTKTPERPRITQPRPPYEVGEWVSWRRGPSDHWEAARVEAVRNEADRNGDCWVVEVTSAFKSGSPFGARQRLFGPMLEACLRKRLGPSLADYVTVTIDSTSWGQSPDDIAAEIQRQLYVPLPPAPGSVGAIEIHMGSVPGVREVKVIESTTCDRLGPGQIAIIVDGSVSSLDIARAMSECLPAGVVLIGSEGYADELRWGGFEARWFTPATWEAWKAARELAVAAASVLDRLGDLMRSPRHHGETDEAYRCRLQGAPTCDAVQHPIRTNHVSIDPGTPVGGRGIRPLYDGLTAAQCLELYEHMQRGEFEPGYMSVAQTTAARALWSTQLRAKVEASAVTDLASSTSVVSGDPDLETANCRDAE